MPLLEQFRPVYLTAGQFRPYLTISDSVCRAFPDLFERRMLGIFGNNWAGQIQGRFLLGASKSEI